MTRDEVEKLATIFLDADGGCPCCVRGQYQTFDKTFPGWDDILNDIYRAWIGDPNATWR